MGTISDVVNNRMMQPINTSVMQPNAFSIQNPEDAPRLDGFANGLAGLAKGTKQSNVNASKSLGQASGMSADTADALGSNDMSNGIATDANPLPAPTVSDKNSKTNVKSGKDETDKLLDNLKPYKYNYKEPDKDGKGTFVSAMAQDLEKAGPIGKSAVLDTPRGKMVDNGRLVATMLPAVAMHHQDIKKMSKAIEDLKKSVQSKKRK